MAGKKPAKAMASQAKQQILDPAIYGVQIKYYGDNSSPARCKVCGKSVVRGMMRLKSEEFYCSIGCACK
jgi:hypothetical protein